MRLLFTALARATKNTKDNIRRGVAIVKKEVHGLLHPCNLADFIFYTSN